MTSLHYENDKKHSILLKATFEIPSFFLLKEVIDQAAAFDYYK